jgi:putative peptide zinc metalloprotease protein
MIGYVIVTMSLVGLVVMPLYKLGKFFYVPGRMSKVKRPRMFASLGGLAALVLLFVFLPLPHSVMSTLEIRPRDPARVYADVPGTATLEEIDVAPGQQVAAGQQLARLENFDVDLRIVALEGDRGKYEVQIKHLEQQSYNDPQAAAELRSLRESLATVKDRLAQQQRDQERLVLRAPTAGTIMPPPWKPRRPGVEGQLPEWSGTPLEQRNLGAPMEEGAVFCLIGDPAKMEAIVYVDQGDIEFVGKGQEVEIKLDELPFDTFYGTIDDVSPSESKVSPHRLTTKAGGELPTETDAAGVERPMSTSYEAKVLLDDPDGFLRIGLRGRAKIHTAWQTLGQRTMRLLNKLVNFKL